MIFLIRQLFLILWLQAFLVAYSGLNRSQLCRSLLECSGQWQSFSESGWIPFTPVSSPKKDALLPEGSNHDWVALVGDSNTRVLFTTLQGILCTSLVECMLHVPNEKVLSKARGTLAFDGIRKEYHTAHHDVDLIVTTSAGGVLRLSFKMLTGNIERTLKQLTNMHLQYCTLRKREESKLQEKCDSGVVPSFVVNMKAPRILLASLGVWDHRQLVNQSMTDRFFNKLHCGFSTSRVISTTLYPLRFDIMKQFDPGHFAAFTDSGRNMSFAATIIDDANAINKDASRKYNFEVFDLHSLALHLDDHFNKTVLLPSINSMKDLTESKRDALSDDGVHQQGYFYKVVANQFFQLLQNCPESQLSIEKTSLSQQSFCKN